ncbi:MAG: ParB/RepB/Spo0J family partition protein [bacterium]
MPKRGLGRGLEALIPGSELEVGGELLEIPTNTIYPSPLQPREDFDPVAMEELVSSIRQHGIVQPVLVRSQGDYYELIAGERRWRAAQLAGLEKIPALVRSFPDAQALQVSLVENLQREDLNPLDVARALKELADRFALTQEELAEHIGKSRGEVANLMRLLHLPAAAQESLRQGRISYGQARALLALEEETKILATLRQVEEKRLSVRQTETLVREKTTRLPPESEDLFAQERERIADALRRFLGVKVRVVKGLPGKIEIEYYSYADLKRIWETITRQGPSRSEKLTVEQNNETTETAAAQDTIPPCEEEEIYTQPDPDGNTPTIPTEPGPID